MNRHFAACVTLLGTYNPDWAIVKQDDAKVYLVRETKSTKDQLKLRGSEWAKIQCGKASWHSVKRKNHLPATKPSLPRQGEG